MRKISRISLLAFMAMGGLAMAGDACCGKSAEAASSPTGGCQKGKVTALEKVSSLLVSWKAVAEEQKSCCPVEQAQIKADFAGAAKDCPVSLRMGQTITFTKGVLEAAAAADNACSKFCPVTAKAPGAEGTSGCTEGAQMKVQRAALLVSLQQLASHALCAMPTEAAPVDGAKACGSASAACASTTAGPEVTATGEARAGCCAKAAAAASAGCAQKSVATAPGGCSSKQVATAAGGCSEKCGSCCGGAAGCCGKGCCELSAKAGQLKSSWEKVGGEYAAMCPEKKKGLLASMDSLKQRSKAVALLPETAIALAEGVQMLDDMNEKIAEHMKANPDALKAVPEEARKCFERQKSLVHAAREVWDGAQAAVKAAHETCPADKKSVALDG